MARQVYYDPFGMRTEGYRAGVSDEQSIQGATRAARGIDWAYNNVNPLTLMGLRREEDFQQYADPFRRKATEGADYDAELARAFGFGARTGVYAPAEQLDFQRYQPDVTMGGLDGSEESYFYARPGGALQNYAPAFDAYQQFYHMTDPALSAYGLNTAQMEQQWRQYEAQLRQQQIEQANSMAWLRWQQSQAGAGGAGNSFFTGY